MDLDVHLGAGNFDDWDAAAPWFLREPLRKRLRSTRLSDPRDPRI